MTTAGVLFKRLTNRLISAAPIATDGFEVPNRGGKYGEGYYFQLLTNRQANADEGAYFTVTTTTPGTGLQLNANVTSFSDTNGFFVIKNNQAAGGGEVVKRIYLDRLKLIPTATLPTGTVAMHFAVKRSTTSREPTTAANRTLLTPVNATSAGPASVARVMSYAAAGAMTVPASAAEDPVVARAIVPTGLGILGDNYIVEFGGNELGVKPGLTAVRATDVGCIVAAAEPVVLEPGEWAVIHMWWVTAATTAATFEYVLNWIER